MTKKQLFILGLIIILVSGAVVYKLSYDQQIRKNLAEETGTPDFPAFTPTPTEQVLGEQTVESTPTSTYTVTPTKQVEKGLPSMEIDTKKTYKATFTTSAGTFTVKLNADKTPITVNNFVHLARTKFYDKTIFHRVIKGFMIQGGDPTGTGSGGPGYKFDDEKFEGEYTRGTLAMANAGPNTNGSQFFIMHESQGLGKNYVIFGNVISGIETINTIANSPVKVSASGENSVPVTPVTITTISIAEE